MGRIEVAPSILSADFGNLRAVVRRLAPQGADRVHIDVMDGHFVPNITFGPALIKSIRGATRLHFETHLMIERPDLYIRQFADAGSDTLIVHHEARHDAARTLKAIRSLGLEAGIAINPATPFSKVRAQLKGADMLLVMGVVPGFGGQSFMPVALEKIRAARSFADAAGLDIRIGVDGGINIHTGRQAAQAGADELVAGTAVFCAGGVAKAIKAFKRL